MFTLDDEVDCGKVLDVNKNDFQQIKNKAYKIGYAEGVNDGREAFFQIGFDHGYRDGLTAGFYLEKYKFFFSQLNVNKIANEDLVKEKEEFKKLAIMDLKSFQEKDKTLNLSLQEYVETKRQKIEKQIPVATSLLEEQLNSKLF